MRIGRIVGLAVASAGALVAPAVLAAPAAATTAPAEDRTPLRVSTYHVDLTREEPGDLVSDLADGDEQAAAVAQVLQTTRPDVVLLNAFDYDEDGEAIDLFRSEYLEVGQHGETPLEYPYAFAAPVNEPEDEDAPARGMVVLSSHPIEEDEVRTFTDFRWRDMPAALLPEEAGQDLPLSTASHWDVPVTVGSTTVHLLASHPVTAEDDELSALRNHDELRFWADYVGDPEDGAYIYDDEGEEGGLGEAGRFVLLGDLGADPHDGPALDAAVEQLLEHPRVHDPEPTSRGAVEAAALQEGENVHHDGPHEQDTVDLDETVGNLRHDYVLPSKNLAVQDAGVFWPAADEPGSELTGVEPFPTSEHRLVWVDVQVPGLD